MNKNKKNIIWRRLIPLKSLEEWSDRLSWVEPEHIIVTEFPQRNTAQVDIFCENLSEAKKIQKLHAGKILVVKKSSWLASQKRNFCLPISPCLCIASEKSAISKKYQKLVPIIIPAGLAFGTGEHATTSMCLHQLAKLNLPQKSVILDAGTGSGILALAAAQFNYRVMAIDHDPSSIREAKLNAARNPKIPRVMWKVSSLEKFSLSQKFDAVVANLYAEILISSMLHFKKLLKPKGKLILSGILKDQAEDVITELRSSQMELLKKLRRGKWICLVAQN